MNKAKTLTSTSGILAALSRQDKSRSALSRTYWPQQIAEPPSRAGRCSRSPGCSCCTSDGQLLALSYKTSSWNYSQNNGRWFWRHLPKLYKQEADYMQQAEVGIGEVLQEICTLLLLEGWLLKYQQQVLATSWFPVYLFVTCFSSIGSI